MIGQIWSETAPIESKSQQWFHTAIFARNAVVTGSPSMGTPRVNCSIQPGFKTVDLPSSGFQNSERFASKFRVRRNEHVSTW